MFIILIWTTHEVWIKLCRQNVTLTDSDVEITKQFTLGLSRSFFCSDCLWTTFADCCANELQFKICTNSTNSQYKFTVSVWKMSSFIIVKMSEFINVIIVIVWRIPHLWSMDMSDVMLYRTSVTCEAPKNEDRFLRLKKRCLWPNRSRMPLCQSKRSSP